MKLKSLLNENMLGDLPSSKLMKMKWNPVADKKNTVNERISPAAYKRMDGLHNVRNMKSAINFLADIATELEDEGFDANEVYEFFMMKIKRNIT